MLAGRFVILLAMLASSSVALAQGGSAPDHVTIAATKDDLLRVAAFKSLHQQVAEAQAKKS